ncbi:MAG: type II toxin-antitoxin system RelE/ParE family toxin [Marinilabiliales bacterium]|nr:MAG: type II toxin-antitoxin system RelE/ParE family toxin [Marinilabiliales bacterium]
MKISWTPTAKRTYFKVLDYLAENWTKREVTNFMNEVESLLTQITDNPEMFQASRKKKNVRKALITKHNTLYYRIKPKNKELELITFWDNRQDPKKIAY